MIFADVLCVWLGQYSVTARVTVIVTSVCSVCAAGLFLLYHCVMLALVRRRHDREVRGWEMGGVHAEEGREKGVRQTDSGHVV